MCAMLQANAFSPNWGTTIFQSANEMANNDMLKKRLEGIFTTLPEEKAAWEAKRQSMREGFMKELEGEKGASAGQVADAPENRKESVAKGSSDEDAVIVEKGGEAASSAGTGGGGGGKNKKKKNKK
jgi:translocation protein SEC66